jgi:hypothetical protein
MPGDYPFYHGLFSAQVMVEIYKDFGFCFFP